MYSLSDKDRKEFVDLQLCFCHKFHGMMEIAIREMRSQWEMPSNWMMIWVEDSAENVRK